MLERLDERVEWMRDDASDRKRQMEAQINLLDQLSKTTEGLKLAVDALTKDIAATVELHKRLTVMEQNVGVMMTENAENTAFRKAAMKWAALIGLGSIIGKTLFDKFILALGVHL